MEEKAGVSRLISEKTDFKAKIFTRKRRTLLIKWTTYHEDVIVINICVLNTRSSKYMKQTLIELEESYNHWKFLYPTLIHG